MEDTQTPPAGEHAETAQTSLSDILSPASAAAETEVMSGPEVGDEPAPQPQPAPEPAPSAQPAPTAETDPAAKPEREQPFWYRKEIQKERQRREAAERRAAELEATRLERRQPQAEAPQRIDPLEDPEGYSAFIEARFERQRLVDRLERSEDRFIDKFNEETFEQTREWLATRPDIEEWALKQRDPWKAAHGQFQKERLAAEIGEDPDAWRNAERERIRAEILAEQTAAQSAPSAAPTMRPTPPAPASEVRSAAPRDNAGRFTGPTPMSAILGAKPGR